MHSVAGAVWHLALRWHECPRRTQRRRWLRAVKCKGHAPRRARNKEIDAPGLGLCGAELMHRVSLALDVARREVQRPC